MLKDLKERLQYRLDNVFARGWIAQLVLVLFFFFLTLLFGMSARLVGLFSPENAEVEGIEQKVDGGGFWDTWWWSLKHLFDPTYFYSNQGATLPVIFVSLATTLLGMVIFATLIGVVSSAIDARLDSLRKGNSSVKESGHILILGWSNKVASIINLLAQFRANLKVVILAPRDVEDMREALRVEGVFENRMRVILRSGHPSSFAELRRMAFESAYSIVVLAAGDDAREDADADIEAIKTMMLLASFDNWSGVRPKIVGEIVQKEKLEIARIAGQYRIPIVSSSQIVSKVVVQCSRQACLSSVYAELFSFTGSALYIRPFPQCAGKRFDEAAHGFTNAVLLGVSRGRQENGTVRYDPWLNPGADHVIASDEWLILMAHSERIAYDPQAAAARAPAVGTASLAETRLERVLILGWNDNLYDILVEYDEYVRAGTLIEVASNFDTEAAHERLGEFGSLDFRNLRTAFRRVNTVMRGGLESLNPASFDCIVILADTSHDEADPDARSIMSLILLQDILNQQGSSGPHLVCEILDPRNRELIARARVNDIVVSPQIVSMLLTQISQQQMLDSVYDTLLSSGGVEIYLKPAAHYVEAGAEVSFSELTAAAQARGEIALGICTGSERCDAERNNGVLLNPGRDRRWLLGEEDRVIVLATDLYS